MSSPFEGFQNAVLNFSVASGAPPTADPITGNKTYPREVATVEAILTEGKQQGGAEKMSRLPGIDQQAIYLEGYAVIPDQLPATIKANTWAECTFAGVTGRFYLVFTPRSPYGVEASTGDRVRGWFEAKV